MKAAWRLAAFKIGLRDAMAYRWEFLLEVIGSAFVPAAMQLVLWYALFKLGGATQVGGMTYAQMVHYTLATVLFTQVRGGNHDFDLQEMIRSGSLSNYLLRPVGVVEFIYIQGVSSKLFIASICLLAGTGASFFIGISPLRLIGAMGLALIGNVIHYQIGAVLATTAFLWEEAYSVLMVKNMVVSVLSGELIPLNLFPTSLQWLWKSTPFYLYVYGPAQYALGRWTHVQLAEQMGVGILWIIFCWLLIKGSWGLGMRRYLSLGG